MLKYNITGSFADKSDNYHFECLTLEEVYELLPISFQGAVRMMMHPGDEFSFTSTGEKTAWTVQAI